MLWEEVFMSLGNTPIHWPRPYHRQLWLRPSALALRAFCDYFTNAHGHSVGERQYRRGNYDSFGAFFIRFRLLPFLLGEGGVGQADTPLVAMGSAASSAFPLRGRERGVLYRWPGQVNPRFISYLVPSSVGPWASQIITVSPPGLLHKHCLVTGSTSDSDKWSSSHS